VNIYSQYVEIDSKKFERVYSSKSIDDVNHYLKSHSDCGVITTVKGLHIVCKNESIKKNDPENQGKAIKKFEVGKEYSCRSICDSNCIFRYTIVSRTDKTVVISSNDGDGKQRKKIFITDGIEWIYPSGFYSMCPIIRAKD